MIRLFVADIFESICCNIEIAFMRAAYISSESARDTFVQPNKSWISESTRCHWIYDRIGSETHYARFLYLSYIFLLFVIVEISKIWIFYNDLKYTTLSILSYYNYYNSFLFVIYRIATCFCIVFCIVFVTIFFIISKYELLHRDLFHRSNKKI